VVKETVLTMAPYGPLSDEEFEPRELMRYRDFCRTTHGHEES
jgi:hypothetical protein